MLTTLRSRRTARILPLAATLALLVTTPVPAGATQGDDRPPRASGIAGNGLIAFEDEGDIHVVQPDGTNRRSLAGSSDHESGPVWSPDGMRLAYWSALDDPWGTSTAAARLIITDQDGSHRAVIAEDVTFPGPISWSPDGDAIAYSSGIPGILAPRIHIAATDGSGSRQVGDPDLDGWQATFSPDGQTLAFMAGNHDAERGLYLMARDGQDVRRLSQGTGGGYARHRDTPRWSPDGAVILTSAGSHGVVHVRLFQVDGLHEIDFSDQPALGPAAMTSRAPAWSPDGTRVAYVRDTDAARVVIAAVDGSGAYVVDGIRVDPGSDLEWSPDGTRLLARAVLASDGAVPSLVIFDPTGEQPAIGLPGSGAASWQRMAD